jgi:cell division protein FtsA
MVLNDNTVFALDIGTRKIVGLVLRKIEDEKYEILGAEVIPHANRSMIDGQIHDVEAVASSIRKIKSLLEEKLNIKLTAAAVAAAGRALKTSIGHNTMERSFLTEIDTDEVRALELGAVQNAQFNLAREERASKEKSDYFCVGYSIIRYTLEEQEIGNLVGQFGHTISARVIATFLPRVVVDSLISALRKSDLNIHSLTLEPIAALTLAVPQNMRILNIALIDIGAGTSDIAIVKSGSIYAYAMVPIGGDELTEHIANRYLLDFDSAETIKCQLTSKEQVQVTDIVGNLNTLPARQVISELNPVIEELVSNVAAEILALNQKAPDAVLCIGGGSLTPVLKESLARALGISEQRIGIRTRENSKHILGEYGFLNGPQGVTSLGIAVNALQKPPVPLVKVTVNTKELLLWSIGDNNVASALLSSGIGLKNIFGKPGSGKSVEINGRVKIVKGGLGTAPIIKVNGKEADLNTPVHNGDIIEFVKGEDGKDAVLTVSDLVPAEKGYVLVNGERIEISPMIMINGRLADGNEDIPDRTKIEYQRQIELRQVLERTGLLPEFLTEKSYKYYLNGRESVYNWLPLIIKVDGVKRAIDEAVGFGASIEYQVLDQAPRIKDVVNLDNYSQPFTVSVNGQDISLRSRRYNIKVNNNLGAVDEELFDGASITVEKVENQAILSDIFAVIDLQPPTTGKLIMTVNGVPAGFTTPIFPGNNIQIKWE